MSSFSLTNFLTPITLGILSARMALAWGREIFFLLFMHGSILEPCNGSIFEPCNCPCYAFEAGISWPLPMKNSHIHFDKAPPRAIFCGSPDRAKWMSETFLTESKPLAQNREYHSFVGKFEKKEILVLSHGVGSAGAMIAFHEAFQAGVKSAVRVGTAGGLYPETQVGDIVVAHGAVRKDGVSSLMVPLSYPAVADLHLTLELIESFKGDKNFRHGIVVTSDLYYPGLLNDELELMSRAGCVAVEMECSTLFVAATMKGLKTGGVFVLDGSPLKWNEGNYDNRPERLKSSMEKATLAALKSLVKVEAP